MLAIATKRPECASRFLHLSQLERCSREVRIYEYADRGSPRKQLVEQLQLLGHHGAGEESHPRDIARRTAEAGYETEIHRVIAGREYDWYRRGCGLGRQR